MGATLLVGFDSAWTATNAGALVGALHLDDGTLRELGAPETTDFPTAEARILTWQRDERPLQTLIALDQPTIVANLTGQRPVEHLVGSPVSRRYGGMQPANTSKADMFGPQAPMWRFLGQFGGPADPCGPAAHTSVVETYPVLAMMALGWTLPDRRATGRLPKYNPERRKTFGIDDWRHVCTRAARAFQERELRGLGDWLARAAQMSKPRKRDQDKLDACLCLLVALWLIEGKDCLMVGRFDSGYIVVPQADGLRTELETRCGETGREPNQWLRVFRWRGRVSDGLSQSNS